MSRKADTLGPHRSRVRSLAMTLDGAGKLPLFTVKPPGDLLRRVNVYKKFGARAIRKITKLLSFSPLTDDISMGGA